MGALLLVDLSPPATKARVASLVRNRRRNVVYTRAWTQKHPNRFEGIEGSLRRAVYTSRNRARVAGIPHTITVGDLEVPAVCPILGIPITASKRRAGPNSPSLDRLRPELGYVPGNVRIISNRANLLKNNATVAEMRAILADLERIEAN